MYGTPDHRSIKSCMMIRNALAALDRLTDHFQGRLARINQAFGKGAWNCWLKPFRVVSESLYPKKTLTAWIPVAEGLKLDAGFADKAASAEKHLLSRHGRAKKERRSNMKRSRFISCNSRFSNGISRCGRRETTEKGFLKKQGMGSRANRES